MLFSRLYKYYRLSALLYVVKNLQDADTPTRLDTSSLTLGAIAIYMLNALIYRPAEGRAETALLEAACQHMLDENGSTYPSMYARGTYFLSDVIVGGTYNLPKTRIIDSNVLEHLYR
jgi:hypothetical protein